MSKLTKEEKIKKKIKDYRKRIKSNLIEQEKVAMEHDYFENLEYQIYDFQREIDKHKEELKVLRKKNKKQSEKFN